MAVQMFGGGVRTLNRMQASNLIDDLYEKFPGGAETGTVDIGESSSGNRLGRHDRGARQ